MSKIAHHEADHTTKVSTDKLTKVAMHATDRGADHATKVSTDKLTKVAMHASDRGADAARESMQVAQRTATAIGERQQETVRQSTQGATRFGELFMKLLVEQARHNMQLATAVAKVQGDFVRGSFERMSQLSGRYLEVMQGTMKSKTASAGTQGQKTV